MADRDETRAGVLRAEIDHHHLAGAYLLRYEREPHGVNRIAGLAMRSRPPVDFSGYWPAPKQERLMDCTCGTFEYRNHVNAHTTRNDSANDQDKGP
jgi:hypothetical protein